MDDFPPDPPPLANADVRALIEWMDATAEWLRQEQAVARTRGHEISREAAANLRLYQDAALLFREGYESDP